MRTKTLGLLFAYDAYVRLVYLAAPAPVVFARNRQRDSTLARKDLGRMLHRREVPLPWEARAVEYRVGA